MAQKPKVVYIIEKGKDGNFWKKCGVAFVNADDSLNLKLDLFPTVQFNIRDPREPEAGDARD